LSLYLDSSALVKRYLKETGSELVTAAIDRVRTFKMCRVGFVETVRAVALAGGPDEAERARSHWTGIDAVEVDGALAEHAAQLAVRHRLRTLDALHLAAALAVRGDGLLFVTWDARLHGAARAEGLRTLPASL
jgi:predicted nucleic acid-binding protein